MDFLAMPYLVFYIALFIFWLIKANRAILFWLYLWQLKEYHVGRFLDHFRTEKGRRVFLNPLYLAKILLAVFAIGFYVFFSKSNALPLAAPALFTAWVLFAQFEFWFSAAVFLLFGLEAAYAGVQLLRGRIIHPIITKKSAILIFTAHLIVFALAISIFSIFLGEMSQLDYFAAAFILLVADIFMPLLVSLVALIFQPLTIWQKNKILARAKRIIANRPDLKIIAIAGSYGKSSTKEIMASILESKFNVLKTTANINTEVGVAKTVISELEPEHQVFVCEIGAVHKGRIKQVAQAIRPKIGILTGINQQHMAIFGSMQNVVDAKFEILEALDENGTAILNWSSDLVKENFEAKKNLLETKNFFFCGKDILAANIKVEIESLSFDIRFRNDSFPVKINARGEYMTGPILLAATGAMAAGMNFGEIARILTKTDFSPFNIGRLKNSAGVDVLNSTYSANPDGVIAHLDYLNLWPGKKVIIMPCIIELGGASKEAHCQIGKKIGQICDLAIITTKDRFKDIETGAISAGMKKENIICSGSAVKIKEILKNNLGAGDVILLEGRSPQAIIDAITQ